MIGDWYRGWCYVKGKGGVGTEREDKGEGAGEIFPCEILCPSIPFDVLFCVGDGGEEGTDGLTRRASFHMEEICHSRGVCEVTGEAIARFCRMDDHVAFFEDRDSEGDGFRGERQDSHGEG